MRLSARPLLDNAIDQALFIGRERELRDIEQALRAGLNCLVVGEPGSGKTSLVRAAMFRLGGRTSDPLDLRYVRVNRARTAADLLTSVLSVLDPEFRDAQVRRDLPTAAGGSTPPGVGATALSLIDELSTAVRRLAAPASPVLVLDDVPAAAGAQLFGGLRDEVWQVSAVWLVTAWSAASDALIRPPADVFFEVRVRLGPLSEAEALDLIERRRDDAEVFDGESIIASEVSARITPRRLIEMVRELAAEPTVGGAEFTAVDGLRERSAAVAGMSRPARMLAGELEALGWASASDGQLLDRLGWTRPRVIQVMTELIERGVVQMREERTGRGRPRKLYRLTPPAEFIMPGAGRSIVPGTEQS